ncbi:hypothetical protein Taro_045416 [Colocasia esculenta]|uniref:Protein kinase domain-containing protein n=1 Tax=Colocasia esculenta TaxID=4460 RepID=A0A843WWI8_COLES|nr:hypothetical protein [Colocasia esculenta]
MGRHHPFHAGGARVGFSSLLLAVLITSSFTSPFSAAEFSPRTSILLNCGSGVSAFAPDDQRPFLPDSASLSSSSSSVQVADRDPSPGASTLYRTARVFTDQSSYAFTVGTTGAHVLRLHFSPFSATEFDLFSAVFTVTALGSFRLLSDFSVQIPTPVIKEFLLWVDSGQVDVTFTPAARGSSPPVAFVNAIEVFTAPSDLIQKDSQQLTKLQSQVALETVHRINMGGPLIVPSNDTLWRTWIPDDVYLFSGVTSIKVNTSVSVTYQKDGTGSTPEVAPERVYDTARAMNTGGLLDPRFNITWKFNVSGGVSHLVRMHFYDFISTAAPDLYFNAYVDEQAVYTDLHPFTFTLSSFSVPFYWDSVVDDAGADGWRLMRVTVGRSAKSSPTKVNAILNGLEIMRVLNASEVAKKKKKKSLLLILMPSVAGVLVLLVFSSLFLSARRRRRRAPVAKETAAGPTSWTPMSAHGHGAVGLSMTTTSKLSHGTTASPRTPRVINLGLHISFEDIRIATNDFDEGLVIGKGGFGSVYRGVLGDGTTVAVKRGIAGGPSNQGYPEFQTEVTVLSRIRHRHLVSLIGFCDENSEMILVYEFMEKGPLKNLLYGRGGGEEGAPPCLSWKQRLEICIGAARGIHYLHTGHAQVIIHRDLKSSNILLGEDYVAKVSDFGLSRLGPSMGETHVSTAVKGSFGYLDPEYFKTQQLTDKSDVYSFGVVLFEVLCARPVLDPLLSREQLNLAEWAAAEHRKGRLAQIVDRRLRGTINPNSLRKFGEMAVKCLAEYGADRPSIGDVLWNLEYCLQLQETELRREPHEDSGLMPVPVPIRRMPSSNVTFREEERDGDGDDNGGVVAARVVDEESQVVEFTTSKVFSQLITHEGR